MKTMSENSKDFSKTLYKIFNAVIILGGIALAYGYLDWGVWQILGGMIVMSFAFEADERGPVWRRWTWSMLSGVLMILGHFYLDDVFLDWGLVLLSAVLLLIIFAILMGIKDYKRGDGSTITFYVLGLLVTVPVAGVVIYKTLAAFGYV